MSSHRATSTKSRDETVLIPYSQALALLLLPRILSASYNLIHDTDESYNYWEPLHFLVHGSGFQTWEYSPVYAIRSWTYIVLHALPLLPWRYALDKEQQFYLLRGLLGIASAATEAHLFMTVTEVLGSNIGIIFLIEVLGSTGMFVASTALLPSTFTMYTSTLGLSFALRRRYFPATVAFGIGAIVGWPFSIILFAPLFIFSLLEDSPPIFSYIRGIIVSMQVLLASTLLDFKYYRIWTLVPLNIVLYNVFSGRDGRGPDLFGTEPAIYYVKNLILNFNILLPFASVALPLTALTSRGRAVRLKSLMGFSVWFAIFAAQAHKEERFMYPVYPALLLSAAIGLQTTLELFTTVSDKVEELFSARPGALQTTWKYFILFLSTLISAYRIHALTKNYSAPLNLFPGLPPSKHYCIGGDWYRFPTSFLLPPNTNLDFVESSFKGLLPGKFNNSWDVASGMNDRNIWSSDKVISEEECDCLITWQQESSPSHNFYFLDRETGSKIGGYYGYKCSNSEMPAT